MENQEKTKPTFEKKSKKEGNPSFFRELGVFMKPYTSLYTLSVLISLSGVASSIAAYALVGNIVSLLFPENRPVREIALLASFAVGCKLLCALLLNLSTWLSHKAAYLTLRDIRLALTDKMYRLPMGYFEENGSGRLKTLMADRIESMEKTLAHMLPELTADLLAPLAFTVWMFFLDFRLALIAFLWMILGFSVTVGMMKNYDEKFEGQIRALKTMNQSTVEYVNGIEVIKNFGRDREIYGKYRDSVYDYAHYNVNWQKETLKYSALGMAIAPFSVFPVLIAGLLFIGQGSLSPARLLLIVLLTLGIFTPLMNAMNYFDKLASMGTSAKEIREVLSYPELKRNQKNTRTCPDDGIVLENVTFSYRHADAPALKHISLTVHTGEMVALVGPSGSGKSTIAKLVAGFFDCDEGSIFLNGKEICAYSDEELHAQISFVDQDTFLFDDTILENIRIGNKQATDSMVKDCAEKAGCREFIESLEKGYETPVGFSGNRLSGGEKQRISIARAMMKNAPILILDEATASTDPENEALIQDSLSRAAKNKTLLVIAHRLSTVRNADQIAYVENGEIKMTGTHDDLLKHCREYAHLWALTEETRE